MHDFIFLCTLSTRCTHWQHLIRSKMIKSVTKMSDHQSFLQNIKYQKVIWTNKICVLLINSPEFELYALEKSLSIYITTIRWKVGYFQLYKYNLKGGKTPYLLKRPTLEIKLETKTIKSNFPVLIKYSMYLKNIFWLCVMFKFLKYIKYE